MTTTVSVASLTKALSEDPAKIQDLHRSGSLPKDLWRNYLLQQEESSAETASDGNSGGKFDLRSKSNNSMYRTDWRERIEAERMGNTNSGGRLPGDHKLQAEVEFNAKVEQEKAIERKAEKEIEIEKMRSLEVDEQTRDQQLKSKEMERHFQNERHLEKLREEREYKEQDMSRGMYKEEGYWVARENARQATRSIGMQRGMTPSRSAAAAAA